VFNTARDSIFVGTGHCLSLIYLRKNGDDPNVRHMSCRTDKNCLLCFRDISVWMKDSFGPSRALFLVFNKNIFDINHTTSQTNS